MSDLKNDKKKKNRKIIIMTIIVLFVVVIGVPLITVIDYYLNDCITPLLSLRVCGIEADNYMKVYYAWLGLGSVILLFSIIKLIKDKND